MFNKNVYECDGLTRNLLSVIKIEQKGVSVFFKSNKVKILDGSTLLEGKNAGNLYEVEMTHNTYSTMLTSDNDLTVIKNYVLCAIFNYEIPIIRSFLHN